jgi:hypothetical protein
VWLLPLFSKGAANSYKGLHFVPFIEEENANSFILVVVDFNNVDDEIEFKYGSVAQVPAPEGDGDGNDAIEG